MNNIANNSIITFASQIIISFFSIITTVILTRILGPEGQGIYALLIFIPVVTVQLITFGIDDAIVYFTSNKKYEVTDIVQNSITIILMLNLIIIVLFFNISHANIIRNFIAQNHISSSHLYLAMIIVPLSMLSLYLNNILLGKERIKDYHKTNILQSCIQLIGVIFFLLILKQGILGALFAYIIGVLGASITLLIKIQKITKIKFSFKLELCKDLIRYGGKLYLGNIAQLLNYRLNIFLIALFLNPSAVGLYSIALTIVERLWMIPKAVALVLFPKISAIHIIEANELTPKIARHTFFITSIISLCFALLAKHIIKLLFGTPFLPILTPLLVMLPGVIVFGWVRILTADLAGRGKTWVGTISATVALCINIMLNIFLIPKWGLLGAAVTSTVSYVIATIIITISFIKISQKSLLDIVLIKKSDYQNFNHIFNTIKFIEKSKKLQ